MFSVLLLAISLAAPNGVGAPLALSRGPGSEVLESLALSEAGELGAAGEVQDHETTPGTSPEASQLAGAIVVVIDTLRADHTSLHGYARETTPVLERWAAEGAMFEHCYAPSSWTLPSMGMLFTGRNRAMNDTELKPDELHLGSVFTVAGYHTAAVLANPLLVRPGRNDYRKGFDLGRVFRVPPEQEGPAQSWTGPEMVDHALEFLTERRDRDRPFLLYLHFYDPHHPYVPADGEAFEPMDTPERRAAFRAQLDEPQRPQLDDAAYAGIERRIAMYDSEIRIADAALGRLERELREQGLWERTLVAVTADHGEGLWQRARPVGEDAGPGLFFNQLYQLHGAMVTEEQVHVPLVWRGPGVVAGQRVAAPVSLIDVLPTLVGLAGLEADMEFDGLDLFGQRDAVEARSEVFTHCSRGAGLLMDGRYKLHVPAAARAEQHGVGPQLYDLLKDPLELQPLDDEALIERGSRRIEALLAELAERVAGAEESAPLSDEERRLLELLGYTEEANVGNG